MPEPIIEGSEPSDDDAGVDDEDDDDDDSGLCSVAAVGSTPGSPVGWFAVALVAMGLLRRRVR
jgi:MYXO-CTERM domain-containing protein